MKLTVFGTQLLKLKQPLRYDDFTRWFNGGLIYSGPGADRRHRHRQLGAQLEYPHMIRV